MRTMLLGGLLLAGCQQASDTSTNKAEMPRTAAAQAFTPGEWATTSQIIEMDIPGMPEEMRKANVGQVNSFTSCMTPEMARKPDANFFTNNAGTTDCKGKRFDMAGGQLKAAMVCTDRNTPGEMRLTIDGSYTADSYQATSVMQRSDGPGGTVMKVTAKTSARRTGDCKAKEKNA
jgi:hypothetical protein